MAPTWAVPGLFLFVKFVYAHSAEGACGLKLNEKNIYSKDQVSKRCKLQSLLTVSVKIFYSLFKTVILPTFLTKLLIFEFIHKLSSKVTFPFIYSIGSFSFCSVCGRVIHKRIALLKKLFRIKLL